MGEWRKSGKRGGFYFPLPVVFVEKNNGVLRKGWWLNRNEAIENLDPTVPPVTCTATTPPVPSCTRGGCHHHLVNSKHEFAVALRGCPVMAAHLC